MKLHFDPNQQFQHDAINSIVDIFEGQPLNQGDFSFSISSENQLFQDGGVGNRLQISEEQILKNIQDIQKKNELPEAEKLDGMNFSIEMETGTGKYEMRLFEDYPTHVNDLTFRINKKDKTIYDNLVPLDSNVEYNFARECESRDDIEFYFKLPFWFKIKTPIGDYNPDWALIKKNEKTVYFVAETKSAGQELRTSEKQKIKCGHAHFNEFKGVKYRQVATVGELD